MSTPYKRFGNIGKPAYLRVRNFLERSQDCTAPVSSQRSWHTITFDKLLRPKTADSSASRSCRRRLRRCSSTRACANWSPAGSIRRYIMQHTQQETDPKYPKATCHVQVQNGHGPACRKRHDTGRRWKCRVVHPPKQPQNQTTMQARREMVPATCYKHTR